MPFSKDKGDTKKNRICSEKIQSLELGFVHLILSLQFEKEIRKVSG